MSNAVKNNQFCFCKATECLNSTAKRTDLAFFPFPSDKQRCEVWLALCGRHDLISKHLRSSIYLCAEHFEKDQFEDGEETILRENAVPTIFPFASPFRDTSSPTDWGATALPADIAEFDPNNQEQDTSSQASTAQQQGVGPIITSVVGAAATSDKNHYFVTMPKSAFTTVTKTSIVSAASGTSATPHPGYMVQLNLGGQIRSYEKRKKSPEELSGIAKKVKAPEQITVKPPVSKPLILQSKRAADKLALEDISSIEPSSTHMVYAPANQIRNRFNLPPVTDGEVPLLNSPDLIEGVASSAAREVSSKVISRENMSVLQPRNIAGNTKSRVVQVAPDLPVQAHATEPVHFAWESLIPNGWQDWPVPTEVFLASAVQLKNNYLKIFPRRDRLDIETTLHLAANYNTLTKASKAHVRARVHHFLKFLQIEKLKDMKEKHAGAEN